MFGLNFVTAYMLRSKDKPAFGQKTTPKAQPDAVPHETEKWIVCRQCQQRLTRPSERIEINGSHSHTFANPSGVVFEIGCFRIVTGLNYIGPPSYEFPWFTGRSWQIVICSICQIHLGWCFHGRDSNLFFGLILDRLHEIDATAG